MRPKYAHVERERRWLVAPDDAPVGEEAIDIDDLYLPGSRCRLRRMTDPANGAQVYKMTRKYDAPDARERPIVTAYLDAAEWHLFAQLGGDRVVKQRSVIREAGRAWTLDRFRAPADLLILEIEADTREDLDALVPPPWAGPEITDLVSWQGREIARRIAQKED